MPRRRREGSRLATAPTGRARAYLRVSLARQGAEGESLDTQRADIIRYADAFNLDIVRWYQDMQSGKQDGRVAYQSMLSESESGDSILVWRLDRIGRRFAELARVFEELEARHIGVIFVTQPELNNRLARNIFVAMADYESTQLAERVLPNLSRLVEEGHWMTRAPGGYVLSDNHVLSLAPDADRYRAIFQDFLLHFNTHVTAERFGMNRRSVNGILANPAYKGDTKWRDKYIIGTHEPLVAPADWEAINRLLDRRSEESRRHVYRPSLLSGLVRTEAGLRMGSAGGNKPNRYYRTRPGVTPSLIIPAAKLEAAVLADLADHSLDAAQHRIAVDALYATESDVHATERSSVLASLDALTTERVGLTRALAKGSLPEGEYHAALIVLAGEEATLRTQLAALPPPIDARSRVAVLDMRLNLAEMIDRAEQGGNENVLRTLIESVIERIVVSDAPHRVRIVYRG